MRSARRLLSQLPAPWEATYAAKTRSELLAAYAAWAPTYDLCGPSMVVHAESVADVEAYLNSDFWLKCERETQWKEVVGEVFEIVPSAQL